ncbi:MAG: OsmC family protein [Desulfosarcina sp.]|nr:OsmC family protein [Desulfosarcina sp.]
MDEISRGNLEKQVPILSSDEFARVAEKTNLMMLGLKERDFCRSSLNKYISPEISRKILSDAIAPSGEILDVTRLSVMKSRRWGKDKTEMKGNTGKMSIQAQVRWIDDLQFVARAGKGPAVVMDTSESGGGAGPMELMLMATAGCTAMDVITILKKKRLNVSGFKINISGDRAEEYPRRFTDITIEYVVFGTDLKPEGVRQAIDLSEKKYCGAMASLNARISHTFRIEPSE